MTNSNSRTLSTHRCYLCTVTYVVLKPFDYSSDDEDEEQVEDHPESTADGEEPIVKTEEGEEKPTKRKAPRHSAPLELKIYETAELAQFNKRNLVADVALLDGMH